MNFSDVCSVSPCKNGGVCFHHNNDYMYQCTFDFYGKDCQFDKSKLFILPYAIVCMDTLSGIKTWCARHVSGITFIRYAHILGCISSTNI